MAKKVTVKGSATKGKQTVKQAVNNDNEYIVWLFDKIDKSGKFRFDVKRDDFCAEMMFQKLIDFSSMKWYEVKKQTHDNGKSKHHYLNYDSLSPEARQRISAKKLDEDNDAIFSFSLTNVIRVIGIRDGVYFHVVWYDALHEFCPSHKKNT